MAQPVKLSDSLVIDARLVGEIAERSIAGQIEYWAVLGRIVDSHLRGRDVLAMRKNGLAKPLSECLAEIETPAGKHRLKEEMRAGPFPRYEAAEGKAGWLLRTDEDGTRTVGRFVNRRFVTCPDET